MRVAGGGGVKGSTGKILTADYAESVDGGGDAELIHDIRVIRG